MRLRSLHCLGPECAVQQFSSTITDPLVLLVAVESLVFAFACPECCLVVRGAGKS